MKLGFGALFFLLFTLMSATCLHAFTPDELVGMKKAGLSERLIVQLVRLGYADAATLLKLKEAGFSDDAILTFAEAGMKRGDDGKAAQTVKQQAAEVTAGAKARIVWYLIYRGKPVVRNSKEVDKAIVSLTGHTLSVAWQPPQGAEAFLSALKPEPFTSPFLWDIAPSDTVEVREAEHQIILRSSPSKLSHPQSEENGYYELSLAECDPALIAHVKSLR